MKENQEVINLFRKAKESLKGERGEREGRCDDVIAPTPFHFLKKEGYGL